MSRTNAVVALAAAAASTLAAGAAYAATATPESTARTTPEPGPVAPAHQADAYAVNAALAAYAARTARESIPARTARPAQATTYEVRYGDTLSGIAQRFCGNASDYPHLAAGNGITHPDIIDTGQMLKLACHAAVSAVLAASYASQAAAPPRPVAAPASPHPAGGGSDGPVVTVTHLSGTLSYAGLEALWEAANGPAWAAPNAAAVAECESGGQQYAENPSGASGYWQILGQVVPGDIFNPLVNAENAVSKFEASGDTFAQWVCQP